MFSSAAAAAAATQSWPWTPSLCTVVDVDTTTFSYLVCSLCDRSLSSSPSCAVCARETTSARLYRLLLSIATADKVLPVVCFDRAARVLLGCSAAELFDFCRAHPAAGEKVGEVLMGEMVRMTLSRPKSGNAEHLRVASVVPLSTGFRPVIEVLRALYGGGGDGAADGRR